VARVPPADSAWVPAFAGTTVEEGGDDGRKLPAPIEGSGENDETESE
jgi:hypothetical protein